MVGLHISSEEIKEIIPILGLDDQDQGKVYLSLLSLGMATLGQISLVSGIDFLKTQDALQVLIGSKLVKRIPGKVGRYLAQEPFLKAFFLAYDPITLVNIRKESASTFKDQIENIENIFTKIPQEIKKQAEELQDQFSQNFKPVKSDFNGILNEFRQIIKSVENRTQINIEELQAKAQMIIVYSEKLNEEIRLANLKRLRGIPQVFEKYIPEISTEVSTISQGTTNKLEKYSTDFKSQLESLKNDFQKEIGIQSTSIEEVIKKFENNRSLGKQNFDNKINEIKLSLKNSMTNALENKSKFQEIRDGYQEIDKEVKNLFSEFNSKISHLKPILSDSIENIRSRKLFKGKEEFLNNLTQIDEDIKSIHQLYTEHLGTVEKINHLDTIFSETDDKIVKAAETGLHSVKKIVGEETQLLAEFMQDLSNDISVEFRKTIQTIFDKNSQEFKAYNDTFTDGLDQKRNNFQLQLNEMSKEYVEKLSNLVNHVASDFEADLESHFMEDMASIGKNSGIESTLQKTNELVDSFASEYQDTSLKISNLETDLSKCVSGITDSLSNFTKEQVEIINSRLNTIKEHVNNQITKIDNQLKREVSSLIFSIKEMKAKLSKITNLSRAVDISERMSSLISSDIVVGESVIIMLLRDLTVRAKSSLSILMPRPELQTMIAASKLPMRTRISIIGDFTKVPKSTLKKILTSNNIRLKQLDNVEFWGCIRDAEELLVCPEPKDPSREELIGVITTNENLVELFSQELMTYTTRSREILPHDLE